MSEPVAVGEPILELLNGFIIELREAGLPVSLTENLDAMAAIRHIPLEDREAFKYALAATLVKNHAHWRSFETVFEVYFSLRGPKYGLDDDSLDPDLADLLDEEGRDGAGQEGQGQSGGGGGESLTPEELQQLLLQAMMRGDEALMRAIARQAVKRFAGMEPGRPVGGTYYLYRTLRNLDLDGLLEKLVDQRRQQAAEEGQDLSPLEERLERDEYEHRVDALKKEIEAEIRRRLVADRGVEAMAKTLRKPLPEDIDFMHASRDELKMLRQAIYPLTRKLAVRLARKRRPFEPDQLRVGRNDLVRLQMRRPKDDHVVVVALQTPAAEIVKIIERPLLRPDGVDRDRRLHMALAVGHASGIRQVVGVRVQRDHAARGYGGRQLGLETAIEREHVDRRAIEPPEIGNRRHQQRELINEKILRDREPEHRFRLQAARRSQLDPEIEFAIGFGPVPIEIVQAMSAPSLGRRRRQRARHRQALA